MASGASAQEFSPVAPVSSPAAPRPAISGPPVAISLEDAVAIGLRDNRTIQSAYLQRVVQKFDLAVAERRFQPRLDIVADVFHERALGRTAIRSTITPAVSWLAPTGAQIGFVWDRRDRLDQPTSSSEIASLFVTQPLLRGGGFAVNMAPVRVARLQEEINRLGLKATVADTVATIVFAYRNLLQAQEQVRLAELSLERTRNLLETNRALIDAGRMAAADIVQTESGLATQQVALLQAQQSRASAQLALLQLLAVEPRTNIVAGDAIAAEHVPIDVERAIAFGMAGRMDVLAQRKALEQARQALLVAKNNRLWDVSVVGTVTRQRGSDPILGRIEPRTDHTIGLQLAIPIGDPSAEQGEVRATTDLRTAELRYEDLSQSVETQIRDAVQSVEASWLQLEAARRARELAARALDLQREKFEAGRASNFEVLSFQADLRAADTQELTASIAYLNALTQFDQQIGSTLDTWQISLND
ncbi:TolC family protein [Sphingomonas gilva]|uniref:TolC family protein n=1 Tax=Sphingomonas gilva TaxID=2305907 RepID=A0A396RTL1_9SPHN|nr:TolC family protein [Sphingomonas gilva]RHW19456.1 TolC family protein [Sphingomonas gilva]